MPKSKTPATKKLKRTPRRKRPPETHAATLQALHDIADELRRLTAAVESVEAAIHYAGLIRA